MKKSVFSSRNFREFYTVNNIMGSKLVEITAHLKMKFGLSDQELLDIYYYVALPKAGELVYALRNENCQHIFLLTFTEMDVNLLLGDGVHYFRLPSKTGLILKTPFGIEIVENRTKIQHRFMIFELARKAQIKDV